MSNTFTRDPLPRIQYSGDGTRTTFAFPFEVLNSDDLLVYLDDSAATGFAISGLGDASGGRSSSRRRPTPGPRSPCCAGQRASARPRSSTVGRFGLRRSTPNSIAS